MGLSRDSRFRGKDGKYYQWRLRKGRLEVSTEIFPRLQKFDISTQLFKEEDPEGAPVAIYHKQRRYFLVLRMSRQPYLEVKQSVMETLDSLIGTFALAYPLLRYMLNKEIVSFLLAEQKRRKKIKE